MLYLLAFPSLLSSGSLGAQQPATPDKSGEPGVLGSYGLEYSTDAVAPHRFVGVHGQKALVMGYPESGLEIWAYPFEIIGDYRVSFRPDGATAAKDARLLLRRVDYRPESVTRTYVGPDFLVREKVFVPLEEAAAAITYEVEGIRPLTIEVHFNPLLNLMWPGALGGQYTRWRQAATGSNGISGFLIAGQANELAGIIGSREITTHDDTVNNAVLTEHGYSFSLRPQSLPGQTKHATVYVALTRISPHEPAPGQPNTSGVVEPTTVLAQLAAAMARMERDAMTHYKVLEEGSLRIITPDKEINRALAWTKIALDQAWVCNPRLGCGIVAGFGPSRDSLRPQYAWFFGGDGLITTRALVAAGEYKRAREELEFIQRYQNPENGMIWHELSQSAGYIDWSKYPYMYVHVDITFDYLTTLASYVSTSGDVAFAKEHWASVAAAYHYCQSSIGTDHLPHIPADKEASDEQHRPADDLSLTASWIDAAAGYAEVAHLTGHDKEGEEARREIGLTRQVIAKHYWNASGKFWYDGHTAAGEPIYREAIGPTQLISQNIFSAEQNKALLTRLTSSAFEADWGMREVAADSKDYNPYSYGAGSVSPLSTLAAAVSFWQSHRPENAFALWKSVLQWNSLDSMGHLHEVLAGNFYHEQTESVPEQTWSSAALMDATVRGLLGLRIDAEVNRIVLAPHLPADWSEVRLEKVRLPHATLDFKIWQSATAVDLETQNHGDSIAMLFRPQIPLGSELMKVECAGRKTAATTETIDGDEQASVSLLVPAGTSRCHLELRGGVAIALQHGELRVGDASVAPKIVDVKLNGRMLSIDADMIPSGDAVFLCRTTWMPVPRSGVTVRALQNDEYEVRFLQPAAPQLSYVHQENYERVTLNLEFGHPFR